MGTIGSDRRFTENFVWSNRGGVTGSPTDSAFYWAGSISGTGNSGNGEVIANYLSIDSDLIQTSGSNALVHCLKINHNFGNNNLGTATGGFGGIYVNLHCLGKTGNADGFYVGGTFVTSSDFNDGGTAQTAKGHLFGLNPNVRLQGTATFWNQIVGMEINMALQVSTSCLDKIGLQIVKPTLDVVKGTGGDNNQTGLYPGNVAISINDHPNATGWDIGLCFGHWQGRNPMDSTGALIGAMPHLGDSTVGTVDRGIDFSLYTFTTAFLKSTGFQVDGSGKITIAGGTPASASATGMAGQVLWDSSFIYVCTAPNTWKRAAIATW